VTLLLLLLTAADDDDDDDDDDLFVCTVPQTLTQNSNPYTSGSNSASPMTNSKFAIFSVT